jgi:heme A synthase
MAKLARFAWGVLVYNLVVIAWGAYVRATRSGAGCGAHWPLCNGEVIPQAPGVEMLVEFSHRVSSGLALLAVVALLVWTWRACAAGHPARRAAAWAMVFMLAEAGVGAALVLFRLVADNASMARALFMSVHLTNTFLLLACLASTAWWLRAGAAGTEAGATELAGTEAGATGLGATKAVATELGATARVDGGAAKGVSWRTPPGPSALRARLLIGSAAILVAGISGAVAALGDTLFPSGTLAQALGADLSPTSHLLIRLRLLHPAIAVVVAAGLAVMGVRLAIESRGTTRTLGFTVAGVALVQVLAGFVNVLLLAPVAMQMAHLLIADALWIGFVLLGASAVRRNGG